MAAISENPILLDLSQTWGSVLIGCSISFMLFGVASMQAYLYFWNYGEDSWQLKLLVCCLWALAASHEALGIATLWQIFVHNYGSILKLGSIPVTSLILTWLQTITACTVQIYFVRRVWLFDSRKRFWPVHVLMIMLSFWSPIAYSYVLAHGRGKPVEFLGSRLIVGLGISSIASEVAVDVFIAIFMIVLLSRQAKRSTTTKGLIHRLQILVINTGMFTAIIATIALIIFIVKPSTLLDAPFYFTFSSAYFCCILTNLNARRFVRGEGGRVFVTDLGTDINVPGTGSGSRSQDRDLPMRLFELSSRRGHDGVMVNVDVERIPDGTAGRVKSFERQYSGRDITSKEKAYAYDVDHAV